MCVCVLTFPAYFLSGLLSPAECVSQWKEASYKQSAVNTPSCLLQSESGGPGRPAPWHEAEVWRQTKSKRLWRGPLH